MARIPSKQNPSANIGTEVSLWLVVDEFRGNKKNTRNRAVKRWLQFCCRI